MKLMIVLNMTMQLVKKRFLYTHKNNKADQIIFFFPIYY
jgi:hypothetical protein